MNHGLRILAAAVALAVESLSAWEFLAMPPGMAPLLPILLLHSAACALFALAFFPTEKEEGRTGPARAFAAFVFIFAFALPGLGMLGVLLAVLPAIGRARTSRRPAYAVLGGEKDLPAFPAYPSRYGPGGFRARLLARDIPAPERLGALLTLRRKPGPRGNRLLKEMLRDPADELRLAAYAALERMERDAQKALAGAQSDLLAAGNDGRARRAALRRLAFLHWEAAYQELADREVSQHHLDSALRAAEEILARDPGDGFAAMLKGRILARLGDWDAARQAFAAAAGSGAAVARLLPHQAESAFQRRDFAAVRGHLAELSAVRGQAAGGPLDPLIGFWLQGVR